MLRELAVDPGRAYYDTNTHPHHHFYFEDSGQLADIPPEALALPAVLENDANAAAYGEYICGAGKDEFSPAR